MGRGRQKAKQTKVARQLKYYTPDTDYRALERELASNNPAKAGDDDYEDFDRWADATEPDDKAR